MKWIAAILALLVPSLALAQDAMLIGAGSPSKVVVAPTYIGPGNVAPGAWGWWGLMAYSSATTGTAAIDMTRDLDANTCTGVKTLANGQLDVSAGLYCVGNTITVTAFCSGTTCRVSKFYDQTGNGRDMLAGNGGNQANNDQLSLTGGPNSKPIVLASGNALYLTSSTFTLAVPISFSGVVFTQTSAGVAWAAGSFSTNPTVIGRRNSNAELDNGAGNSIATTAAFHVLAGVSNPNTAPSGVSLDGTFSSGGTFSGSGISADNVAIVGGDTGVWDGSFGEMGIWTSDLTSSFSALSANARLTGRWGSF